jgi:3-hydroxyacyl-[acyl-carrier-protein] dehydratase
MDRTRDAGLRAREVVEPKNGTLDKDAVSKIIPHREPFLFIDKVEIYEDKRAVGIKKITGNEEFFKGHFPGNPIMPGVLIIEALAQLGGILMLNKRENLNRPAYFVGLNNVRFRKAVIPGDTLTLEVDVIKLRSRIVQLHGVAKVESDIAAEIDILFGFSG